MKNINNAFNKLKKTCNVIWASDDLYIYILMIKNIEFLYPIT